jgi:putative serine protease PepD
VILRELGVAVIVAVIGLAVVVIVRPAGGGSQSFASSSEIRRPTDDLPASWVEQVAARVSPSVVMLESTAGGHSELGSGVVLSPDGLIMTNNHVLAAVGIGPHAPARTVVTLNDGRTAAFDVIAADPQSDIALVRAKELSGLIPISIGSSGYLRIGQPVAAVGSPLGLQSTITAGVISALNRPVCTDTHGDYCLVGFGAIQTDTALNPGNSGGALVDTNGRLIGVTAAEAAVRGEGSDTTQHGSIGLGFAIPVDHAARIAAELIATGRASHAWLGAQASGAADNAGARILSVTSGSPAEAAGLTVGAVVTKVDNHVIGTANELVAAVLSKDPGAPMTLGFTNSFGDLRTVGIVLGTDHDHGNG